MTDDTATAVLVKEVKTRRFWNRSADKYARRPISDQAAYERKLEISRKYLNAQCEVLEIGCGTGSTAIVHAPYVRNIRATDLSTRMIEIATDKAREAGVDNVKFEACSIEDLEVETGSLDVIMAHSVIHLVDDRDAVLNCIQSWLNPGGVLIASTACIGDMMWPLRMVLPLGRALGLFPLVRSFTREALETSIRDNGLALEESWRPSSNAAVFHVARKTV